ncbi:MULE domain-containing protein, partial [Trichostrongylus colubriformis]
MNIAEDGLRHLRIPDETSNDFRLIIVTPKQVEILRLYSSKGISIDDTHCTTQYDLKLATIMTVDDYRRGMPKNSTVKLLCAWHC